MVKVERGFIGFLFLAGLVGLVGSLDLTISEQGGAPGPGLMPLLLSIILMILTASSFIVKMFKGEENKQTFFNIHYLPKQGFFILFLIISTMLINIIGMLVSIGLLIFLTLLKVESKSWKISLFASVSSVMVMYLIFDLWLGLTLPTGYF